jgi:hypothetical protein
MIGRLKIEAKNDSKKVNWEGDKVIEEIRKAKRIAKTLAKIRYDQYNNFRILIKNFH